jgi:hypothetical protein
MRDRKVSLKIFFVAAVKDPPERFAAGVWFLRDGLICDEMIQNRVLRSKKNEHGKPSTRSVSLRFLIFHKQPRSKTLITAMKQLETLMTGVTSPNEPLGLRMSDAKTFVGCHLYASRHPSGRKS